MATFKRKRDGDNGDVWYVQIADHNGVKRRLAAFKSKAASEELERAILRLVSARQVNGALSVEDNRFIESAPTRVIERLAKWGVIDHVKSASAKNITAHVADWRTSMEANGLTPKQIAGNAGKVERVAKECSWTALSDITVSDMEKWRLAAKNGGMALMTTNHYLAAAKAFYNWLVAEKRMTVNPLTHMKKLNAATDRRRERHPYTVDELGKLLATAEAGGKHHGLTGHERALVYRLAAETGFRYSEIRSLTRASFTFDGEQATVTIKAEDAKNGKEATQPLLPELAADLKAHMALFLPTARAFRLWGGKGAPMIHKDLEAAGILSPGPDGKLITVDEYGLEYDFHGLRHAFGTLGAKAGIPLAVMQRLMRHSDPKLTANLYTHILLDDKVDALRRMPSITVPETDTQKGSMTGTTGELVMECGEILDTPTDTQRPNTDGQIRTYTDNGNPRKWSTQNSHENQKALNHKGLQGIAIGAAYPIRTGDLRFTKPLLYH